MRAHRDQIGIPPGQPLEIPSTVQPLEVPCGPEDLPAPAPDEAPPAPPIEWPSERRTNGAVDAENCLGLGATAGARLGQ
jgi:hypothetical protein